jgi:hypothetical protein
MVTKVRERLTVNQIKDHKDVIWGDSIPRGKEKYSVEISYRFVALEVFDAEVEINSAWKTIRDNINISAKERLGYFELRKHKPLFDKGLSKLLNQRKQANLQWFQDPSKSKWG